MLNNIHIVLVRTFHPGNIGSAARAMKTMGLTKLTLVNPRDFPSKEAHQMAMSADDVLDNATVVDSLYEALKDCTVVVASTARSRGFDLPSLNPEESAEKLYQASSKQKVALLFGPERMGLSNDDLKLANYRVTIPTSPDYSSLNMAAAVQTLCYEVFKAHLKVAPKSQAESLSLHPTTQAMEQLYVHLEETLHETGFIIKKHPGEIMQKLRTLFTRAQLDETELNILRGILASVQKSNRK